MADDERTRDALPLSALDLHVLLVLAERDLYGYAIMKAVEAQYGAVAPEIGSLYRVLARLSDEGLVREVAAPEGAEAPHRGRPRKYYGLTEAGLRVACAEVQRLKRVVEVATDVVPEAVR